MPLHPQARTVLDLLASAPVSLKDLPPAEARATYDRFIIPRNFEPAPVGRVEDRNIPRTDGGSMRMRVYWPESAAAPLPALLFIHGGGFVIGSIESRDPQCRILCREVPCIVVTPDYRLAPEHPFPGAPEDCWTALQWLVENAATLGVDVERIAVGGESAGGNLATGVAQRACSEGAPRLIYQMLVYPTTDFFFTLDLPSYKLLDEPYFLTRQQMQWYYDCYAPPGIDRSDLRLSPGLAPDLSGLPPAQIITAEFDPLRDDGHHYATRLRAAGVQVEYLCMDGMMHGYWHYGRLIDAARTAIDHSVGALRKAFY